MLTCSRGPMREGAMPSSHDILFDRYLAPCCTSCRTISGFVKKGGQMGRVATLVAADAFRSTGGLVRAIVKIAAS